MQIKANNGFRNFILMSVILIFGLFLYLYINSTNPSPTASTNLVAATSNEKQNTSQQKIKKLLFSNIFSYLNYGK